MPVRAKGTLPLPGGKYFAALGAKTADQHPFESWLRRTQGGGESSAKYDLWRERVINAAAEQDMRRANEDWGEMESFEAWLLRRMIEAGQYEKTNGPSKVSNRPGAVQMFTTRKP